MVCLMKTLLLTLLLMAGFSFAAVAEAKTALPSDVKTSSPFAQAITFAVNKSLMTGYTDGSFKPDRLIRRAELLKILTEGWATRAVKKECAERLADHKSAQWYDPYICAARSKGLIAANGDTHPDGFVTLAEGSKLVADALDIPVRNAKSGEAWYAPYIQAMQERGAVPFTLKKPDDRFSRGELALMLYRLDNPAKPKPVVAKANACTQPGITGVDMGEVRRVWLSWINTARKAYNPKLVNYTYNQQLDRTAILWSQQSSEKGVMTHKRPGQTVYYDYTRMKNWFASLGLIFENDNGSTFTENIGWGPYNCSAKDCTQTLIDSIRTTFDFYMAEKGKNYRPHWNSIMNDQFTQIGMGLIVNPVNHRYYITTHYGTVVTSSSSVNCN